jgi:hypothetical protein
MSGFGRNLRTQLQPASVRLGLFVLRATGATQGPSVPAPPEGRFYWRSPSVSRPTPPQPKWATRKMLCGTSELHPALTPLKLKPVPRTPRDRDRTAPGVEPRRWGLFAARAGRLIVRGAPPMFRFTIRDLLWLTLLAAVLVTWWIDRSRQEDRFQRERQAHQKLAAWVSAGQWGKVGGDLFLEPPPLPNPSAP